MRVKGSVTPALRTCQMMGLDQKNLRGFTARVMVLMPSHGKMTHDEQRLTRNSFPWIPSSPISDRSWSARCQSLPPQPLPIINVNQYWCVCAVCLTREHSCSSVTAVSDQQPIHPRTAFATPSPCSDPAFSTALTAASSPGVTHVVVRRLQIMVIATLIAAANQFLGQSSHFSGCRS